MENKSKALEYLNIPRSTFYYVSKKDEKDLELKKRIEEVLQANPSYGHRRISIELKINRKRIKRVMKKFDIRSRRNRKKPVKQWVNDGNAASPNLIKDIVPLCKNHIWVTDFTYIKWHSKFVYLATVIDLYTREVVGLSIKTNHSALLTSEALLNALASNPHPEIIHSDQGSEYKAKLFRKILGEHGILQSMSKKGSPWQNGFQESFYGNFKVDIGNVNRFETLGELAAELYRSIFYYNNQRIHLSLGMAPRKFAEKNTVEYNINQEILVV